MLTPFEEYMADPLGTNPNYVIGYLSAKAASLDALLGKAVAEREKAVATAEREGKLALQRGKRVNAIREGLLSIVTSGCECDLGPEFFCKENYADISNYCWPCRAAVLLEQDDKLSGS